LPCIFVWPLVKPKLEWISPEPEVRATTAHSQPHCTVIGFVEPDVSAAAFGAEQLSGGPRLMAHPRMRRNKKIARWCP
jgi:hypothetical protein